MEEIRRKRWLQLTYLKIERENEKAIIGPSNISIFQYINYLIEKKKKNCSKGKQKQKSEKVEKKFYEKETKRI